MNEDINIQNNDSKLLKEKSPFGRYFVNIAKNCEIDINKNLVKRSIKNPCYFPDLIDYLLTYYLPILPLWSGIILGHHGTSVGNVEKDYCHYSNAIIENWMRIVKIDILQSKTNLRPGDLIKQLHDGIFSRMSAFKFAFHPRADNIFRIHKRIRENSEELTTEEWSGKIKKHCRNLQLNRYDFIFYQASGHPMLSGKSQFVRNLIYNFITRFHIL